jgi:hypothetical protein
MNNKKAKAPRYCTMPPKNCDIKNVNNLVVTFRDGITFDDNTQILSKGRHTIVLNFQNAEKLLQLLINIENDITTENTDFCDVLTIINQIGYEHTTFNFECCGGCNLLDINNCNNVKKYNQYYFTDVNTSNHVIALTDYVLKQGSCVMFADFSFKALINNWNIQSWGICPFRHINTMNGIFKITYPLETTKQSQFSQLAQIASMVTPDDNTDLCDTSCFSINVHALQGTLVYDIKTNIVPNITLYVHSVITDTSNITDDYIPSIAHGSKNIHGLPVHTVVNFKNIPGIMIVSNIHFKELVDVNVDTDTVIYNAEKILGRQRSKEMAQELESQVCPQLIRSITSSYVAEITNGTNQVTKKRKINH